MTDTSKLCDSCSNVCQYYILISDSYPYKVCYQCYNYECSICKINSLSIRDISQYEYDEISVIYNIMTD